MTAARKCFRDNKEKFMQSVQMQISQKPKTFCQIIIAFFKSTENFEQKKQPPSSSLSKIINSKKFGCQPVK